MPAPLEANFWRGRASSICYDAGGDAQMIFKSPTVLFHIARGILGLAFLVLALEYASRAGWWAVAAGIAALVCLGGCPMCWIVGLIDTVLRRKSSAKCVDGSC